MDRILITFPGKLGDLIYSLPAVINLKRQTKAAIYYQTGDYCLSALNLLSTQPYINGCLIDRTYIAADTRFGLQPYIMSEPDGFDHIYHLGFRPDLLGRSILTRPLIDTFFFTLSRVYNVQLAPYAGESYIFINNSKTRDSRARDKVVFQGWGHTLMDLIDKQTREWLESFWRELLQRLDREIIIITGPDQKDYYSEFEAEIICPATLLESAELINQSRCFIGVQSAAAALADGLKKPRLVFSWFKNAIPAGANAITFGPGADPVEVSSALKQYFNL